MEIKICDICGCVLRDRPSKLEATDSDTPGTIDEFDLCKHCAIVMRDDLRRQRQKTLDLTYGRQATEAGCVLEGANVGIISGENPKEPAATKPRGMLRGICRKCGRTNWLLKDHICAQCADVKSKNFPGICSQCHKCVWLLPTGICEKCAQENGEKTPDPREHAPDTGKS